MSRVAYFLLFFGLCLVSSKAWAQTPQGCCVDCTCLQCGAVAECETGVGELGNPANCVGGGTNVCGTDVPEADPCTDFAQNNSNGGVCVPIDGNLGFLIVGGLGMGLLGMRRRQEDLVFEAC